MTYQNEWNQLKIFLATAPTLFDTSKFLDIKTHTLPNGDKISCILYDSIFYISSNDILKILYFRLEVIGRSLEYDHLKKFKEWVFSDLRKLKQDQDWILEESNSKLLEFLLSKNVIKKAAKQKVYYWWSVPHEDLLSSIVYRLVKLDAPSHFNDREIAQMMRNSKELELVKAHGSILHL